MKKKLILVAAPPACGKTYVSQQIAKSLDHIVFLDKDDLCDLMGAAFDVAQQPFDMDGEFYAKHLRTAEYSTIVNMAFSTLRFSDKVLLNAPFGKESRDVAYMKSVKERANQMGADLIFVWVTAPLSLCYARMKMRNAERDAGKLQNWDAYVSKINYAPPQALADNGAVDSFVIFDTQDDNSFRLALENVINIITGE